LWRARRSDNVVIADQAELRKWFLSNAGDVSADFC